MTFSLRLKEARKKRGLTQAKLADAVGITRQSIIEIENGATKKTFHIVKISSVLGVSPAWLEFGEGSVESSKIDLNQTEKELVTRFRMLNKEDKKSILRVLSGLNN